MSGKALWKRGHLICILRICRLVTGHRGDTSIFFADGAYVLKLKGAAYEGNG